MTVFLNIINFSRISKRIFFICLIFVISFGAKNAIAHRDICLVKDFGLVKLRLVFGFGYEEINKAQIIAKLVDSLRKSYNYKKRIILDFKHRYFPHFPIKSKEYFISFDKQFLFLNSYMQDTSDKEETCIVISSIDKNFDEEQILKLVEYAIKNVDYIKKKQKQIIYHDNFSDINVKTIDTNIIKKQLTLTTSDKIKEVLNWKVQKIPLNDKENNDISYYVQNQKFHIFIREDKYHKKDSVVLVLDKIFQMEVFRDGTGMVFDTDSSFYYIGSHPILSKRQIINNSNYLNEYKNYRTYEIFKINKMKISFTIDYRFVVNRMYNPKSRTLLYLINKDYLIQDLDESLKLNRK